MREGDSMSPGAGLQLCACQGHALHAVPSVPDQSPDIDKLVTTIGILNSGNSHKCGQAVVSEACLSCSAEVTGCDGFA